MTADPYPAFGGFESVEAACADSLSTAEPESADGEDRT